MAHHLNYNALREKHSFFSVKEKAWHGLGTIVDKYPSSTEAIAFAGLDYEVRKWPMYAYDNENLITDEPHVQGHFATVRTDTREVLGVVKSDYQVVQNWEAFRFFDSIVGGKQGILYETAGALGRGERVFITAKLPDYIRVGRQDWIEQYLFLTTSHDGSGSITASFTPVRIVCQNTLNAALRQSNNCVKIKHVAGAAAKLETAHELLGISHKLGGELEQVFNQWSKVRIADKQVKRLVQMAMVPNAETLENLKRGKDDELSAVFNNAVEGVLEYAGTNPTQQTEETKGTLYGAYNAVTGYFQNVKHFKTEEAKLKSVLWGTAFSRVQATFDLCLDYEKNGVVLFN